MVVTVTITTGKLDPGINEEGHFQLSGHLGPRAAYHIVRILIYNALFINIFLN